MFDHLVLLTLFSCLQPWDPKVTRVLTADDVKKMSQNL